MGAISPGRWQLTQRFMKMGATFSANVGFSPSAALAAGTAAASARPASAPFKKPGRVSIIGLLVLQETLHYTLAAVHLAMSPRKDIRCRSVFPDNPNQPG